MKYQKIVQASDRILYLIGKQGISYQETQKTAANIDTLWNPENFLAIVWQLKHRYLLLYEHINSGLGKDLFCMSPILGQNELIGIAAKYTIQICLKKVKCHFISLDEVTNAYVYVYICICVYMCNILKQWWLIVQLKTVPRCDTTSFTCFCFLSSKKTWKLCHTWALSLFMLWTTSIQAHSTLFHVFIYIYIYIYI